MLLVFGRPSLITGNKYYFVTGSGKTTYVFILTSFLLFPLMCFGSLASLLRDLRSLTDS